MIPRSLEESLRDIQRRLRLLERRLTVRNGGAMPSRGPSSYRDQTFPPPTTTAEKVALANRRVTWFNTTYGWEESYYARAASGLTAPALDSRAPDGWYPVGRGPWTVAWPQAAFGASTGNYIGGWLQGKQAYSQGADSLFEWMSNGATKCYLPGMYRVHVRMNLVNGSGTANFHLRKLGVSSADVVAQMDGGAVTLLASLTTTYNGYFERELVVNEQSFAMFTHAGSLTVHFTGNPRSEFLIEYVGPPLALP